MSLNGRGMKSNETLGFQAQLFGQLVYILITFLRSLFSSSTKTNFRDSGLGHISCFYDPQLSFNVVVFL